MEISNVRIEKGRSAAAFTGSITLTPHVMLFSPSSTSPIDKDIGMTWLSTIVSINRKFATADGLFPVYVTFRHFLALKLYFVQEIDAATAYAAIQRGMNITSLDQVYAFTYRKELDMQFPASSGSVFDPEIEYGQRMGLGSTSVPWRLSTINKTYEYSSTYPAALAVPSRISDNVLKHIGKFRSKGRIPALSYIHRTNRVSITRSSQPMVGLKQNRSIQDEKLVEAIFASSQSTPISGYTNLIIDARPTTNAIAQTAMGAGTESSENYGGCRISYLGIDNIHVVRDSFNKLFDAFVSPDATHISKSALEKSGWLRHIRNILDGTLQIVQSVHLHNAHVLVHCSDGWDRTAQLSSLAQLCLDPYYRTINGFQVLLEKEWVSFGHKFKDRCGHLCHDTPSVALDNSGYPPQGGIGGTNVGSVGMVANSATQLVATQFQVASKSVSTSFSNAAKSFLGGGKKSIFGMSTGPTSPPLSTGGGYTDTISYGTSSNTSSMLASSETLTPNNVAPREISPVFPQFLDCLYQLWTQFPNHFEFDERLLGFLYTHLYSCQFGTFLFNNERERSEFSLRPNKGLNAGTTGGLNTNLATNVPRVSTSGGDDAGKGIQDITVSIWDHISANRESFISPVYVPPIDDTNAEHPDRVQPVKNQDSSSPESPAILDAISLDDSNPRRPMSPADIHAPGSGTGRISSLGTPGTVSEDYNILFPTTSNLRYWTSFYIKNGPLPGSRSDQGSIASTVKLDSSVESVTSKLSSATIRSYTSLDRPLPTNTSTYVSGALNAVTVAPTDPLFSPSIPTSQAVRSNSVKEDDCFSRSSHHPYTITSTTLASSGSQRVGRPALTNPWAASESIKSGLGEDDGTSMKTINPSSSTSSHPL
ncbi:hypothetical protein BASA50_006637 [Batrachochytrium salamandrivorans]|uniref:Myotubularin phosphatase domain-containing protein n=1 Tax=Batrachochytrium salamandrivorans TaxID=1357716 RepID=A0ABQ8F985_9FUNG|nr:hypothetical protein BASA50_006637 [Batrachochytrium salamandrivorans]